MEEEYKKGTTELNVTISNMFYKVFFYCYYFCCFFLFFFFYSSTLLVWNKNKKKKTVANSSRFQVQGNMFFFIYTLSIPHSIDGGYTTATLNIKWGKSLNSKVKQYLDKVKILNHKGKPNSKIG